jgi:CheY-like chemotaxis protein
MYLSLKTIAILPRYFATFSKSKDAEPRSRSTRVQGSIWQSKLSDLIFCDIHFPGEMDGYDFAKALRSDSDISHIPLVAVSGYITEEDRERAISTGFDLVFPKPVKFADLRKALSIFSKGKS